jgi:hypothetical protein
VNEIEGTGSRLENETVIIFNDLEGDAVVDTASPAVYRRLVKLGYVATSGNEHRARFVVPKRDVRLPRPRRAASEAQRRSLQKAGFKSRTHAPGPFPAQTPSDPATDTSGTPASLQKEVFA